MTPRKRVLPWMIVLDAMFTIFHGRRGHRQTVVDVYRRHGHLSRVKTKDIWRAILDARMLVSETVKPKDYWAFVAGLVLSKCNPVRFPDAAEAVEPGRLIYKELHSNPDLYMVPSEIRRMLYALARERDARRRTRSPSLRLLLGSNQEQEWLIGLLEHFGLVGLFDGVYTSEILGEWKPHLPFWSCIATRENLPVPRMLYVGNSPGRDAPGALVGGKRGEQLDSVYILDLDGSRRAEFSKLGLDPTYVEPLRALRLQYWGSPRRLTGYLIQHTRTSS
ncbi:TPA: hypothetical protein DDZ10_00150 [Candidatus Uhrbacteria bacterium]|uniref:HAD family hydrolase n=1 Tax=Candidatus Uhrbacteria bacterium GW2011_GWC2_53_7 TaxID=1618986 RepID=A0A0G1XVQ1_9BACT|nr:MAG: hypothetical protein UY79_C0003G0050 [Parcubacteria group bacterium GW2011_GWA2_53_21]KKW35273.1 MAG: hypothetical protein UY82_C0043G0007 [Candidatus Uhrbacteria bacterium GW2011_GWC2_53_7]HBL39077.1 hypothetical protein [Candidatus Uhrbacteria bacterium]